MSQKTEDIRNIALLGHHGVGKTSLLNSILKVTLGNTRNLANVTENNSLNLYSVDFSDKKFNFIDTPGSEDFFNEVLLALKVCKGAIIMIDGTKGIEIGTLMAWKKLRALHIPAVLFINMMDKANINYETLLEDLRTKLGKTAVPFTYPIGKEEKFEGFVNVINNTARIYDGEKCIDVDIWPEKIEKMTALHNMIVESVATLDENIFEKYINGLQVCVKELTPSLRKAVINGELTPVICGAAAKDIGTHTLLNMLYEYLPSPSDLNPLEGVNFKNENIIIKTSSSEPLSGFIFKSYYDPYMGIINLVKINRGILNVGDEIFDQSTGEIKKIGSLYKGLNFKNDMINQANAGDIVVVSKTDLKTNTSITHPKIIEYAKPLVLTKPTLFIGIQPKTKSDEDKISNALNKLSIDDPTFTIIKNKETSQILLGVNGETQINTLLQKLNENFKVQVDRSEQKIVYRETISNVANAEGKHKKQSGGAGQYGHVFIKFEPTDQIFEFASEVVGGCVPKNYFPAIEKGLIEAFETGPLTGFPLMNVKATVYDGSQHPVDSNELSFKLAAILAYKNAVDKLGIEILEPISEIKISTPEEYLGDIMSDLNKRRARINEINTINTETIITCYVPEGEIIKYATELKALSQGFAIFTRDFYKYELVPQHLKEGIMKENKKI